MNIALNPALDPVRVASAFARGGRVHIPQFLTHDSAARLHGLVRESDFALREGLHHLYDGHVLSRDGEAYADPTHDFSAVAAFCNSGPFLDFARCVTGNAGIAIADAQATRYRPGHFLSRHEDAPGRVAAYVLNLTPRWRPDWGGALLFCDRPGHFSGGYLPAFNALNILAAEHLVGFVSPFAGAHRLSVSGWSRSQP
jgi:Rps23 Pro-64 3,4-dihydroxylase Tpa1-like proline 4-hydroxylase